MDLFSLVIGEGVKTPEQWKQAEDDIEPEMLQRVKPIIDELRAMLLGWVSPDEEIPLAELERLKDIMIGAGFMLGRKVDGAWDFYG